MRQLIKKSLNSFLKPFGLCMTGIKAEENEKKRLLDLVNNGHFDKPVFPIPEQFIKLDVTGLFDSVGQYEAIFRSFRKPENNSTGYTFKNDYYSSPDAEILYTMVREYKPERIIEVGSGNSTRIIRMAIEDEKIAAKIFAIDPEPRLEIKKYVDKFYKSKVEDLTDTNPFCDLKLGDILFIDSSHELRIGNDVAKLYCEILPNLPTGVIIHIHDILLPWEYKKEWIVGNKWKWSEQYLVSVLLDNHARYEVLWAGYYLQKTFPDFNQHFPNRKGRDAQSLWLRIK